MMPQCGAENPDYIGEYVCEMRGGHGVILDEDDVEWDHAAPSHGAWWRVTPGRASLAEALAAATKAATPGCGACAYLAELEEGEEKTEVSRALAGTIGYERLAEIFREHNVPVGRRSIKRHRAHIQESP